MSGGIVFTSDRCWERSAGLTIPEPVNGVAGDTQSWFVAVEKPTPSLKSLSFLFSSIWSHCFHLMWLNLLHKFLNLVRKVAEREADSKGQLRDSHLHAEEVSK